jgi:hypothetical protein
MKTRRRFLTAFFCAAIATFLLARPTAQAGFIVMLAEQGPNVVATGNGAIDLTGLVKFSSGTINPGAGINPNYGYFGGAGGGLLDFYLAISGPLSFGTGGLIFASSSSGSAVGVSLAFHAVFVPLGYTSNGSLSDISTYNNASFSSLGVTPGTYDWTWGNGANQTFTLQIGPAGVPDQGSTISLLLPGLAALFSAIRLRSLRLG